MVLAKKSYGQHFLKDQSVIDKIIAAAEIAPGDLVVEVGPGTGALTKGLAPISSKLVLIEADAELIPSLTAQFPEATIIKADAAKYDFSTTLQLYNSKTWTFVSNLPYNSGNAILMNVLTSKNPPTRSVVMLQKEVGERMLWINPGVLSVAVQLYAQVERVCIVPPGAFSPPPKVESMVLKLVPHPSPLVPNPLRVIEVAKAGFANRRKQLHRNLSEASLFLSEAVKAKLVELGHSPLARAEELSLKDWIDLSFLSPS
ncbi:MAG: 16S rRNA (adenine(1518)-N(6)/adenine(1519)-N(6))-dimethyltransferase RsmA [Patescibacteria group bacterium]